MTPPTRIDEAMGLKAFATCAAAEKIAAIGNMPVVDETPVTAATTAPSRCSTPRNSPAIVNAANPGRVRPITSQWNVSSPAR
jgi:hypothetical protein